MGKKITALAGAALLAGLFALRLIGRQPNTSSAPRTIQSASELEVGDIVHVSAGDTVFQAEIVCVYDGLIETADESFYTFGYIDRMLSSGQATVTPGAAVRPGVLPRGRRPDGRIFVHAVLV